MGEFIASHHSPSLLPSLTSSIQIYDTTLRDGTGEGSASRCRTSCKHAALMSWASILSRGLPCEQHQGCRVFQRATKLPLKSAKICAFGMTRRRGMSRQMTWNPGSIRRNSRGDDRRQDLGLSRDRGAPRQPPRKPRYERRDRPATWPAAGAKGFTTPSISRRLCRQPGLRRANNLSAAARAGARLVILCDTTAAHCPRCCVLDQSSRMICRPPAFRRHPSA